jgi:enamine deaminase RidA (YjgF/YER057c/UK114 family)
MSITLRNPAGLPSVGLYHQVSIARGSRFVFVAGQVARDAEGVPVGGGDLAAQVEQCYVNLGTALAEAEATFDDVAKLTVYLVDWSPEKMPQIAEGITRAGTRLGVASVTGAPLTGIGVAALAEPDMLVEVEAIAVVELE